MSDLQECEASLQAIKEELSYRQVEYDALLELIYGEKKRVPSPAQLNDLQQKGMALTEIHNSAFQNIKNAYQVYENFIGEAGSLGLNLKKNDILQQISELQQDTETSIFTEIINLLIVEINQLEREFHAFEQLKEQIKEQLLALRVEYQKLVDLKIDHVEDKETYQRITNQSLDPSNNLAFLLNQVLEQVTNWKNRIKQSFIVQVEEAFLRLENTLERLINMGVDATEDATKFKEIDQLKKEKQNEEILNQINKLEEDFKNRIDEALSLHRAMIEQLRARSLERIRCLHSSMPEVIELVKLINVYQPDAEGEILNYERQLKEALDKSYQAGSNALAEFQLTIDKNPNYVFPFIDDVERIGTALYDVAELPEQYSGPLWGTCSEALLRVEMAGLDGMDQTIFYNKYGFRILQKSFQASLANKDFFPLLSLFNSQFAPPNTTFINGGTLAVLTHEYIYPVFQSMVDQNLLKLAPVEVYQLTGDAHKVLLLILKNSKNLGLPIRIRLQWSAILHNVFQLNSPEHHVISQLLLDALCDSGQYLSLYYSLHALGPYYKDLWTCPDYRVMLDHVIRQVYQKEEEGVEFLVELCHSPGIEELVRGDEICEFLLACLSLYLFIEKGEDGMREVTWMAWDRLKQNYPTLVDLVLRQIQGEEIGSNLEDEVDDLRRQFEERQYELSNRIQYPPNDHPVFYTIYTWYMDKYFRTWLDILRNKDATAKELNALKDEIRRLRKEDVLAFADSNLRTRMGYRGLSTVPGRLRQSSNSRMLDLIEGFDKLVKIRLQLVTAKPMEIDKTALKGEMEKVIGRSPQDTGKWAILHLLKPELPFISSLVDK